MTMTLSGKASMLVAMTLALATARLGLAQPVGAAAISPRVLPSVVVVDVQRSGGARMIGTGFVAVKDGLMVTALHVLRDATKVTVTFATGEQFEAVGLVDKDDRRNLALVRIRAFGRPVLEIAPGEPAVGDHVFVAVVKNGAFGLVEASVAEVMVQGPMKFYRLAGDIPGGNSGSPVVNAAGEVVGMHVTVSLDGRDIEAAVPATYTLGLEPSLPVQPWTPATPEGGAPAAGGAPAVPTAQAPSPANQEIDANLAAAMINIHDWWAIYGPLSGVIYRASLYSNMKNLDLYTVQSQIDSSINSLRWLKAADPLRDRLVSVAVQLLASERQAIDLDLQCWLLNKDAAPGKRNPQAEDAARRATALFEAVPPQVASLRGYFQQLAASSPSFLTPLSSEMRYFLGIEERKSKLVLGVYLHSAATMQIFNLVPHGLAVALGLRSGELVVSAGGRSFNPKDDMEDFKLLVEENAGRTLEVVVKRSGKLKTLKLTVPADVTQKYGRGEGDGWQA